MRDLSRWPTPHFKRLASWFLFATAITPGLFAQPPAILQSGVMNAASMMPPPLGGGALARGSLVVVRGLRFGTPADTSIAISQGGVATAAQVLSVKSTEIEFLMPANAPLGDSTLELKSNGQSARPYAIKIVRSSFGIFPLDEKGWSPGRIEHADGELALGARPAKPGETVTLTGTGLGDDRAPQVFVGGVAAAVRSAGPGRQPGTDRIAFVVPAKSPEGCYVPVLVRVREGRVSNAVTMAIHRGAGPCRPPEQWGLEERPGQRRGALIVLARTDMTLEIRRGSMNFVSDDASAMFLQANPRDRFFSPLHPLPPPGTCTNYTRSIDPNLMLAGSMPSVVLSRLAGQPLRAGPIKVSGEAGSRELTAASAGSGFWNAELGGAKPSSSFQKPLFLNPGEFTVSSTGGPDIGPFEVRVRTLAPFRWTNEKQIHAIDRTRGVTVEFEASPDESIGIVAANIEEANSALGLCFCLAPPGSRSFSIPPLTLQNVPPSTAEGAIQYSVLALVSLPAHAPPQIHSKGIDLGLVVASRLRGIAVDYK